MTTRRADLVGIGIYTPSEAAYYARVTTQTMVRWVHGSRRGDPVFRAQLEGDTEKTVTFLDLVQALAIRAIRREFKVPLPKIREAVEEASQRYSVDYPFAMHHKTFLFDKEIHIELPKLGSVQISGKQKGQLIERVIAEPYLVDLTFSDEGLAVQYRAFEYRGRCVVIDPARRLGQPIIKPCNCLADSLLDAYRSEGSVGAAARAYGVDEDDVLFAIQYDDHLGGRTAA